MKRVMLFLITNLAVVLVLGIVLNIVYAVTGLQPGSLSGLLVMAAVFGFGGSFISLMMSKGMALRSVGGMVIESPRNETEHWLIETVEGDKIFEKWSIGFYFAKLWYYERLYPVLFTASALRNVCRYLESERPETTNSLT